MSSPYITAHGDFQELSGACSPAPSPPNALYEQEPTLRPMRLKVLYSSDTENKINCLAKWPEILNIRTAHLDEETQIGVIELKTCIQAIVSASPELDCKYGTDYTIYAYDYSEYETPLVGQGMLSRALASISSTPSAPAHESDTIVTGRVCRNPLGLFGNGIQEVLEVKLRLVPVPTKLQHQYVETMKQQRDLNGTVPEGCDPRAWQDFLKHNPGMLAVLNQNRSQSPALSLGQPQHGIEQVQRLVSEGYRPQSARGTASYAGSVASGGSNRSGSPTPSLQSMATTQPFMMQNRPISRASDPAARTYSRRPSLSASTEFTYEDDRTEEGPQRKRAKVMRADHPGKTTIGKAADSLRVTASTAASIRVLQPSAIRPSISAVQSLEGPPRAPTPTPGGAVPRRRVAPQPVKSNLAHESSLTSDSGYRSLASDDMNAFSESALDSPENDFAQSDYNSPDDMASSPPIMRNPAASVAPSSPVLPALPQGKRRSDSSGFEGVSSEPEPKPKKQKPWISENTKVASGYNDRTDAALQQAQMNEESQQKEISMRNARRAIGLKRAQTWSGDQPSSDPVVPDRPSSVKPNDDRPKSRNPNWNKEKRKMAMQTKLHETIESGQMPQFCENCGAIETPTWRKAYSRVFSGDPKDLGPDDEDNGILLSQVLQRNAGGSSILFKIYRKVVPTGEEGYADVLLCNPCGIWLTNKGMMRPESHWGKRKPKADKPKEKRSKSKKKQDDGTADQSDMLNPPSEAQIPGSEMSMDLGDVRPLADGVNEHTDMDMPNLPPMDVSFIEDDPFGTDSFPGLESNLDANDVAALERAIRASPGNLRKSPRHLEKQSSDPARRTLFPSPKSDGPLGMSIDSQPRSGRSAPKTFNERRSDPVEASLSDKENQQDKPGDDKLSDILPVTPSRKSSDALALRKPTLEMMKTPLLRDSPGKNALTTGDFFSSAAKAYLHAPRTPSRTPTRNSNGSQNSAERNMTPFGQRLSKLLAENQGDGERADSLDDLNLPPLTDRLTTPGRGILGHHFDFGDFSSDLPNFPSSPGWFDLPQEVYEENALGGPEWRAIFGSAEKARTEPRVTVTAVDTEIEAAIEEVTRT